MKNSTKVTDNIESIAVREFYNSYGDQLKLRLVTGEKTLFAVR